MEENNTSLIDKTVIEWKSGFFSDSFKFYKEGEKLGFLKDRFFSDTAFAEFKDLRVNFKSKGFFNRRIIISDQETDEDIGSIHFGTWSNKAVVSVGREEYHWKYDNFWNSRWSLRKEDTIIAESKSRSFKGSVSYKTNDALLMLAAMFIAHSFSKKTVMITIVIVIVIAA